MRSLASAEPKPKLGLPDAVPNERTVRAVHGLQEPLHTRVVVLNVGFHRVAVC
jgi:hypothetical protein